MVATKQAPKLLRFWANRSSDEHFRLELDHGDSVEQTVVRFEDGVCVDVELSYEDTQEVFFGSGRESRFGGFDATVESAWFECNRAFARRLAS